MAMRIPVIRGVIDRRILVNYRVDAEVLAKIVPPPFRPKLVHGFGMAGICLIRLKQIRPRFWPRFLGMSSENAAHRIAVQWDQGGGIAEGVFIPRRDSSSRLNALVGGRLFPGVHHHAAFQIAERHGRYEIALKSDDGHTHVRVTAHLGPGLPPTSVFSSLDEASTFFKGGSLGYSVTAQAGSFDGLELRTFNWQVRPLAVEHLESSFFEDRSIFPAGSGEFDNALLMEGIDHEWYGRETLCASGKEGLALHAGAS
jgi:hypothetical protein